MRKRSLREHRAQGMSWFRLLLFNGFPEAARRATRGLYYRHYKLARRGSSKLLDMDAHYAGLSGALRACYQRGILHHPPFADPLSELAPFFLMSREASVEALAEYVLWRQRPSAAKRDWLAREINQALCVTTAPAAAASARSLAPLAFINGARWSNLLYTGTRIALHMQAGQLSKQRSGMTTPFGKADL